MVAVILFELLLLFWRGCPPAAPSIFPIQAAPGILPFLIILEVRTGIGGLPFDHPNHEWSGAATISWATFLSVVFTQRVSANVFASS